MARGLAIILALAAASASQIPGLPGLDDCDEFRSPRAARPPKNKHGLTDEEIAQMRFMSPKEKKKFLKGIR